MKSLHWLFPKKQIPQSRKRRPVSLTLERLEDRVVPIVSPFELSTLPGLLGAAGFVLNGVAAGDNSGFPVSRAGDINGDGLDDLIIGAYHADPHGVNSGAAYVVFGDADGFGGSVDLAAVAGGYGRFCH